MYLEVCKTPSSNLFRGLKAQDIFTATIFLNILKLPMYILTDILLHQIRVIGIGEYLPMTEVKSQFMNFVFLSAFRMSSPFHSNNTNFRPNSQNAFGI
jgi:hypothetical protein